MIILLCKEFNKWFKRIETSFISSFKEANQEVSMYIIMSVLTSVHPPIPSCPFYPSFHVLTHWVTHIIWVTHWVTHIIWVTHESLIESLMSHSLSHSWVRWVTHWVTHESLIESLMSHSLSHSWGTHCVTHCVPQQGLSRDEASPPPPSLTIPSILSLVSSFQLIIYPIWPNIYVSWKVTLII